ncbi:MAG: NUDIX hydrolase [Butyrivibrio sp.]|nr:NUDIX hydrolase [Butyrivibrio sp.]
MKNDNNDFLEWKQTRSEQIINDKWIDLKKLDYRMPDGSISGPYYKYKRKDYVVIVATDDDNKYLCVRQFRQGIGHITTEFPAGAIEDTDILDEEQKVKNALEAAKRELAEETGYKSDEWRHILTIPSDPTLSENYAYIFSAKKCKKKTEQKLDNNEFLNFEIYSKDTLFNMIFKGDFEQPVHVMAAFLERD